MRNKRIFTLSVTGAVCVATILGSSWGVARSAATRAMDAVAGQISASEVSSVNQGSTDQSQLPEYKRVQGRELEEEKARNMNSGAVGTGPFYGLGTAYDGADLLITQSNMNKDLGILLLETRTAKSQKYAESGMVPHVQLSGYVEGQFLYLDKKHNNFDLSASEVDVGAWVTPWVTGYTTLGFDNNFSQNSNIRLFTGFFTFGNLTKTPFYATVGQFYVPFGVYSTGMSNTMPLTRAIGRIQARALRGGYYSDNLTASVAGYNGQTNDGTGSDVSNQFAANVAYRNGWDFSSGPLHYAVNLGYTNNLAESEVAVIALTNVFNLTRYVPALDLAAKVDMDNIYVTGEIVDAIRHFAKTNLTENGQGVKPRAYNLELGYRYPFSIKKHVDWTLSYGESTSAAAIYPIKKQFGANASVNILKNIVWSFEFSRRKDYGADTVLGGTLLQVTPTSLPFSPSIPFLDGKWANYISTTIDAFF